MFTIRVLHFNSFEEAEAEIFLMTGDRPEAARLARAVYPASLKLDVIPKAVADAVNTAWTSQGGKVLSGEFGLPAGTSDLFLDGNLAKWTELVRRLQESAEDLGNPEIRTLGVELKEVLQNYEGKKSYAINCRGRSLTVGRRTLIMGILNVTPDSFSDGGRWTDIDAALDHAQRMIEDGADIIDVGGESTRPGHIPVSLDEELRRVLPVVERLASSVEVPISVDTSKAQVARRALEAGAHIINDVWGLHADPEMAEVAARFAAPVIIMHNKDKPLYRSLMAEISLYFKETVSLAEKAGVKREKIILDPGLGFAKNAEHNLEVTRRLRELAGLGFPILIGPSRKNTIGKVLNMPVDQRVEGTAAMVAAGIINGADIIRVHDVKEMTRVARMTDAIRRGLASSV
ncbi:MAG: dihydropteroate synthase [Firmicutes bacterium]|nr:dihydropteroate synthase [Bacillota bacterium]MCL5039615.1 dihydropteroate synthase [Bacillota bacterium]